MAPNDRARKKHDLATTIASQALHEYKIMLGGALNVGVTPVEVKEIVYQVEGNLNIGNDKALLLSVVTQLIRM